MKNNKKTIDALQSDLAWLDDIAGESDVISNSDVQVKGKSARGQLTKTIEIGGQTLVLSKLPSANSIAGAKEISKKTKGIPKSESHRAAIRAAAAKRRGKPNGRKGISHSEIHKQRIGDGNRGVSRPTCWKGRKHREDSKEKIRQHNLNREAYVYTKEQKTRNSLNISAGKKGKPRSPEMLEKMAQQRAMNFKTPIGIFRDRSKAEKAYLERGHSKQDFKKLYIHQPDKFYFTTKPLTKAR